MLIPSNVGRIIVARLLFHIDHDRSRRSDIPYLIVLQRISVVIQPLYLKPRMEIGINCILISNRYGLIRHLSLKMVISVKMAACRRRRIDSLAF